jgi:nucleotide-binding universal stress UspA family protein
MPNQGRKKILVPLDGSKPGERALKQFTQIVAPSSVREIVLLQVVAAATPGSPLRLNTAPALSALGARQEKARRYLEGIRRGLARRRMGARAVTRAGAATDEILACAKAEGAGLIVMATRGRSGIRRVLMGSVAESVLRRAPVPVLLVRASRSTS